MLTLIAWLSIALALISAAWIALDEVEQKQPMAVMNVVWPVSGLYFGVFAVWAYWKLGRPRAMKVGLNAHQHMGQMHAMGHDAASSEKHSMREQTTRPTLAQVAVGTSHCGAGCMLADLACSFWIAASGITLLGSRLWAEFAIDLLAAWTLGVVFQYWAIKPMGQLSAKQALVAAIKADTLSILAFQVGMYAFMAVTWFVFFPAPHLDAFEARYWFMMQLAMIAGFATSFPMNALLIRMGVKEAM
ncbi:MAG: DUF4396 domain-containing protein [Acidobacteriota bacterium]|nr:DUF4396 domain-containing protein [Acidobacteriota bacterium]